MNPNKSKLKQSPRQKITYRAILVAGISCFLLSTGIFVYLQVTETELSNAAAVSSQLDRHNLPVEMVVTELSIAPPDTNSSNGQRYIVAKPLSLTPKITN